MTKEITPEMAFKFLFLDECFHVWAKANMYSSEQDDYAGCRTCGEINKNEDVDVLNARQDLLSGDWPIKMLDKLKDMGYQYQISGRIADIVIISKGGIVLAKAGSVDGLPLAVLEAIKELVRKEKG